MAKRLVLALAACLAVTAGAGADDAYALSEPKSTYLRALSQTELKALIADIDAQGLNTSGTTNVKTGVQRMQLAAGRLGALATLGQIAVGSYMVYKIAEPTLGGFIYRKITGQPFTPPTGPPSYVLSWVYCNGTGSGNLYTCNQGSSFYGGSAFPAGWYLRNSGTLFNGSYNYCNPATACAAGNSRTRSTEFLAVTGGTEYQSESASNACSSGSAATCVIRTNTEAGVLGSVTVAQSDATEYAATGSTQKAERGTADSTISDPELEAALDAIDPVPGTAGTAVEEDTAEAILDELDPGWETVALLQPLPNETYTAYVARLEAAGWLGTATSTVLASENEAYGPEAVVRVIVTEGATTTVYDPLGWPATNPEINWDTDITIRYNPDTAAEAPTSPTETPVSVPPTTVPPAGGLDFSPITDIDWGCKFPYGLICYAIDFTEQFDVGPDAPVFSFNLGFANGLGGGYASYVVDLDVMDDYMDLWRTILSVCLWVGAVYWLASRLLGFNAAGDPGEAIDDVM